jgi:dipeptidyl aminopeptidase/acylaminoacyl peptidase
MLDPDAADPEKVVSTGFIPEAAKLLAKPCETENVEYETFDKLPDGSPRKISAIVFKPARAVKGAGAGVVWAHGGPSETFDTSWYPEEQVFCQMGYYLIGANVRGSSVDPQFEKLNDNDWGGGDYQDYEYARRYLIQRFNLPPARVGIAGASYGGYMTNWAATQAYTQFSFGVTYYGMSDLLYQVAHSTISENTTSDMGDPASSPAVHQLYVDRSPMTHAETMNIPLLMIHGSQDNRTPVGDARLFAQRLTQLKKDATYVEAQGDAHFFKYIDSQKLSLQSVYSFLWRVAPLDLE